MKKQIIFIHGGEAFENYEDYLKKLKLWEFNPEKENKKKWSKELANNLGEKYQVLRPAMPCKYNAKYLEWKIWFEKVLEFVNDKPIFIGHSLGGTFLLKYLSENILPFKVKKLFLVAPAFEDMENEVLADFNFILESEKISKQAKKIILIHSKDDFVVPFSHLEKIKEKIPEAEFLIFEDRGHFLQEEFPEILEKIKE